jgi:integrase
VSQGGAKTFVLKVRNRRITVGRYPTISLQDARSEAKKVLAEITLGKRRPTALTYAIAIGEFIEDKRKSRRSRTADDYQRNLGRLGYRGQLRDLNHREAARLLKRIKSPASYNYVLVTFRVFCNWAIKRRYLDANPTLGLSRYSRKPRTRVLSDAELRSVWDATADYSNDVPDRFRTIVQLLVLSGQRRGEVATLRTSYVEGDIATLPSSLTKNNREHVFPLADQCFGRLDCDALRKPRGAVK